MIATTTLNVPTVAAVGTTVSATSEASKTDVAEYLNPSVLDKFSLNTIFAHIKPTKDQEYIYTQALSLATATHYNHPTFNNKDKAKQILEYYVSVNKGAESGGLDPLKAYFTKQDVQNFEKYLNGAKPEITNSLSPAYEMYSLYAKRATEFWLAQAKYVLSLDKPLDLNTSLQIPNRANRKFRDNSKQSFEEAVRLFALDALIAIKVDKPNFTWDQIRARFIRSLVFKQRVLNNYDQSEPFKRFMTAVSYSLDTHSAYFANDTDFSDGISADFVGIGVRITQDQSGVITFPAVIPGGPAAKQGELKGGEELEAVSQDGKRWISVSDMDSSRVVNMIKGKINTYVWIKVLDKKGNTKIIKILRGKVPQVENSVNLERFKDVNGKTYGVIKFNSFYIGVDRDIRNLLRKNPNLEGLIIDLRANGGGLVEEVQGIADIFLPTFSTLFQVNNNPAQLRAQPKVIHQSRNSQFNIKYNRPVIVLTSMFSASASEILAAAIQDYQRGIIVGAKTYGKGTVQAPTEITPFANDGLLKLTINKFFRVTGNSTQFRGVTPDINFPEIDDRRYNEENSINPLPYTFVNPTRYSTFSDYVSSSTLDKLKQHTAKFFKTNQRAKNYVEFRQKWIQWWNEGSKKLNYNLIVDRYKQFEEFELNNYNYWASLNNKPKFANYDALEENRLKNFEMFKTYDPYLDLTKELLVKYVGEHKNAINIFSQALPPTNVISAQAKN